MKFKQLKPNRATDHVQLYTPHPLQKQIHDACEVSSPNFYTVVVAGRQSGKTMAAENQLIYWALKYPGAICWYVCHKDGLIGKVYRDIVLALRDSGFIKRKSKSKGGAHIELTNGTIIEFKSARAEDSLRGNNVNFMIVDEAAFINKNTLDGDIMPTMKSAGKKVLICSTPKGKNWLFEFYMRGLDPENKDIKSFKFNSYDTIDVMPNKEANLKLLETFKQNMSPELFSQEFLAEFVDSGSVFRNIDKVCILPAGLKAKVCYMGCDIGFTNDFTVVAIIDEFGNLIYYDRFKGLEKNEVVERIKVNINIYKPRGIVIEENNQGWPIIRALEQDGISGIESFKTTGESKGPLINQLIAAFSGMEIKLINDEELKKELMAFIFDISPSGKIRYKAGFGHDDIVMAIAFAWYCYSKNFSSGEVEMYTLGSLEKEIKKKEIGMGTEISMEKFRNKDSDWEIEMED